MSSEAARIYQRDYYQCHRQTILTSRNWRRTGAPHAAHYLAWSLARPLSFTALREAVWFRKRLIRQRALEKEGKVYKLGEHPPFHGNCR